jgi:lipopolysaccharide assembly protein A
MAASVAESETMKLVHWLITAPLALVLVVFAVANRETISLTLWPAPVSLNAPIYLVVLLALLVGFLIGELVAWINSHRARRETRALSRRVAALERELADKEPTKTPAKEIAS